MKKSHVRNFSGKASREKISREIFLWEASPLKRRVTPLAYDEFRANGEGYQRMIDASAAQRVGTSDEIAEAAAFLLGEHARFITGTDLLIDGGVIASIRTGEYQLG